MTGPQAAPPSRRLVLGLGNILMGDEGAGIHVVRYLEKTASLPHVDWVDGGTGGMQLLEYFMAYDPVIIVDATRDGRPPGSLNVLKPEFAADYPSTLFAHDVGIKNVFDALHLLDKMPEVILVTISIGETGALSLDLSPELQAAVPSAAALVLQLLSSGA
jgi:hydrogenase maturation protease